MYTTCNNEIKYMKKLTHTCSHKNACGFGQCPLLRLWGCQSQGVMGREESPGWGSCSGGFMQLHLCSLLPLLSALLWQLSSDKTLVPQSLSALLKLPAVAEGDLGSADAEGSTWSWYWTQATKVTKEKTCALGKTLLALGLSKENNNKASRISKSFCYRQLEIATAPPPVPGTCLPAGSGSGSPSRWPVCPWGKAKQVPHKWITVFIWYSHSSYSIKLLHQPCDRMEPQKMVYEAFYTLWSAK